MLNIYDKIKNKIEELKEEIKIEKNSNIIYSNEEINLLEENSIFEEIESYLENNKKTLEKIKVNDIKNIKKLNDCIQNIDSKYGNYSLSRLQILTREKNNILNVIDELKRMSLLVKLTQENKKIILIGGNGSGKSSLADYLKQSIASNVVVFPAQKYLYLVSDPFKMAYKKNEVQNFFISRSAKRNNQDGKETLIRNIRAVINEHMEIVYQSDKNKNNKRNKSMFDKFQDIYGKLIPEIEIEIDTDERILYPKKNGVKYSFDLMSEGEKTIVLYILEILLAPNNSYIIVDEPESHLNVAIVNKLWDLLCEEREDCKFIFISHNIDFINSRGEVHLVWCKSFNYPNDWELEDIQDNGNIPLELITQLVGNKKSVIFCEGEKNSLDYRIYSNLFLDKYNIYPVKGHKDVINYTKAYSENLMFKSQNAYGIIDGDLTDDQNIENLEKNNVIVLPFNEIEMFLLNEEIIVAVLSASYDNEIIKEKIQKFKEEFINKVKKSKNKIILNKLKKEIDSRLEKEKIQHFGTLDELTTSFNKIVNFSLDDLNKKYSDSLEELIRKKDYCELLKWCSLKEEISKELANRYLEEKYIEKAIFRLTKNVELKEQLKKKYFKML